MHGTCIKNKITRSEFRNLKVFNPLKLRISNVHFVLFAYVLAHLAYYKKMVLSVVNWGVSGSTNEETNTLYFRNAEREQNEILK